MQCCDSSWEDVGPAGHKETDVEQEWESVLLGLEQILENICKKGTEESSQVLTPPGRGLLGLLETKEGTSPLELSDAVG